MSETEVRANRPAGTRSAGAGPVRRTWRFGPEVVALGVLLVGAGLGLALWAKWGLLIALQTVATYCF